MDEGPSLREALDIFRQGGVDLGGDHQLLSASIACNGPIVYVVAVDVRNDVWVWANDHPESWTKLPRVPFMVPPTKDAG